MTKDKAWKNLCSEASPGLQESSAAGYQLRRHYQKHLLPLECQETGANAETLIAFADKLKKKKKEKDPSTPSQQPEPSQTNSNAPAAQPPIAGGIPQHPSGYPPQEQYLQKPGKRSQCDLDGYSRTSSNAANCDMSCRLAYNDLRSC